jgi:hypothetical protein
MDKNSPKFMNLVWVLLVVFSFAIRVPGLYDTSYQWRSIHTEMTAYWFVREGINLINYQTPLFGPPWQIPIEFPLFQATAAIIFKAGLGSLDFACRLTALLFFYISALFLHRLCQKIFLDNKTSFMILAFYLWLPFNINYSTEPLIDYLALALVLAYLYFILRWLDTRSSFWNALLAMICGSLGILVKPTTMPVVVIPIIVFVLKDILAIYGKDFKLPFDLRNLLNKVWTQRFYWLSLTMMVVIPVLAGSIWTRHADFIKEGSVFTEWHTSKAMLNWYFGTWALRTDQNVWINTISEAERLLLPYGLSIFAILGIFIAVDIVIFPGETTEIRLFLLSILASLGVVLAIFLSLYQQQYYFISFSASMAILGGYGLARFWQLIQRKRRIFTFVFAIWAIIFLAFNAKDYKILRNTATSENRKLEKSITRVQKVQKYIPLDKWVVVVEYDWDPSYIYPLQRKAMVITPRELGKPVCQVLADERFTLVVVADRSYDKNEELLNYTFQCFKSQKEVLPGVFVVTH